jgi:hypothetical protein
LGRYDEKGSMRLSDAGTVAPYKCSQTESLRIGCSATAAATSGHSIVVAGANARPGRAKRSTIPAAIGRDRDLEHYGLPQKRTATGGSRMASRYIIADPPLGRPVRVNRRADHTIPSLPSDAVKVAGRRRRGRRRACEGALRARLVEGGQALALAEELVRLLDPDADVLTNSA